MCRNYGCQSIRHDFIAVIWSNPLAAYDVTVMWIAGSWQVLASRGVDMIVLSWVRGK